MYQDTVDLVVPEDLADILITEGLARSTFERRSTTVQILAESATVASIAISLLQGPGTVMQVARAIKLWTQKHKKDSAGTGKLTVVFSQGAKVLIVEADTDITVIAEIVHDAITKKDAVNLPPEDFDGLTI